MSGDVVGASAEVMTDEERRAHEQLFVRNAVNEMVRLFFEPELHKRVSRGELQEGFQLSIAQALVREDGPPVVRFNEEVRLQALARAPRDLAVGDQILQHELGLLHDVELPRDELDCGHATVLFSPLGVQLFFNFRYGRERAASFIDEAEQFLETAADALARGRAKVALENLHTAYEKVSIAHLIVNTRPEARGKTHGNIRSGINIWGRTGNISPEFVKLFNWITDRREKVRYNPAAEIPVIPPNAFDLARAEIFYLRQFWRWRDGNIELLKEPKRPDLIMVKLEDGVSSYVLKSI